MSFARRTLSALALLLLSSLLTPAFAKKPPVIDQASLLKELVNRDNLARLPEYAYKTSQFSSYDRRAVAPHAPGWFGNDDWSMFLRTEENQGRTEHVLLDAQGPGAIVRFWMTFAGENCGLGTLRIYIDGATQPILEGPALDLISGGVVAGEPLSASVSPLMRYNRRGHNLYYPIPYARHCKVTYESPNVYAGPEPEKRKGTENVYYNIECRTYTEPVEVISYAGKEDKAVQALLQEVQSTLSGHTEKPAAKARVKTLNASLRPQQTVSLDIQGAQAIREISLSLQAENLPQALRSTVMCISFDGEQSVWVPVGDFMGIGYQALESRTYFTQSQKDGPMKALWVMPFAKSCHLSFTNFGAQEVKIQGEVTHSPWKWDHRSLHFGAAWHQYTNVSTGANNRSTPRDIVYNHLKGTGRYVGDCLVLYNTVNGWWGEGDEKVFVDGERFPSHFGTGTEDYYGYAWCRPEVFTQHPFISMPSGDGNLGVGLTVNARFRSLDAIPFSDSLRFDMELWHWQQAQMNYAPTTLWYMRPGGTGSIRPDTLGVQLPVVTQRSQLIPARIEAGIEGEDLEVMACTGGEAYGQYRTNGLWNGNTQLFWHDAPVGSVLTLQFDSAVEAPVLLQGIFSLAKDYGNFRLSLNGKELTPALHLYAPELTTDKITLGQGSLLKGKNTLTLQALSPAPGFQDCFFGLDRLILHFL